MHEWLLNWITFFCLSWVRCSTMLCRHVSECGSWLLALSCTSNHNNAVHSTTRRHTVLPALCTHIYNTLSVTPHICWVGVRTGGARVLSMERWVSEGGVEGGGSRGRGGCTWSRPVTPIKLSPGHTPKMVPTVKLVSTMEDPSRGSKATLNPSPA